MMDADVAVCPECGSDGFGTTEIDVVHPSSDSPVHRFVVTCSGCGRTVTGPFRVDGGEAYAEAVGEWSEEV